MTMFKRKMEHLFRVETFYILSALIFSSYTEPVAQNLWRKEKPLIEFSNSLLGASSGEVVLTAGNNEKVGDSLNVTCYSSLPAEWVVVQGEDVLGPNFAMSIYLIEIEVTNRQDVDGHRYASHLFIDNIKFDYTGLYVCRLTRDLKVNNTVYIFAEDLENPFTDRHYIDLPHYPNHLTLYMSRGFTVPCQTSSPDINITFRCICDDPKLLGPEQGVTFDPKRGVRIATVDRSFDGLYVCETTINNVTYTRRFSLLVHVDPDMPPTPYLVPSGDIHTTIGETLSLQCFVKVFTGIRPVLSWSYSNSAKQDSNRTSIMKPYRTGGSGLDLFRGDFEVRNVTPDDQGIYRCTVWISDKNKGKVETHVYIHGPCPTDFHGDGDFCNKSCPGNCAETFCLRDGGCISCKDNKFHTLYCNVSCSDNCRAGCNQGNGNCLDGCVGKFHRKKCELPCNNCKTECNADTGDCSQDGCVVGHYGSKCENDCAKECVIGEGCEMMTGKCGRCEDTNYGDLCELNCNSNCVDGKCDRNGTCTFCSSAITNCIQCQNLAGSLTCMKCTNAKHGEQCENSCPPNCEKCSSEKECTHCKQKYYGEFCRMECGVHCESNCDKDTGVCDACRSSHYGDYCNHTCPQNCGIKPFSNSRKIMCHKTTGDCLHCQPGFFGEFCDELCSNTCGKNLLIGNNPLCNKADGTCLKCDAGFYGEFCKKECSENCEKENDGKNGSCDQYLGHCDLGCMAGWYNSTCEKACNSTCKDRTCHWQTAECSLGCENGYKGIFCEMAMIHGGIDAAHFNSILSTLGLPAVSPKTLKRRERAIGPVIELVAKKSCMDFSKQERNLTSNEISENGDHDTQLTFDQALTFLKNDCKENENHSDHSQEKVEDETLTIVIIVLILVAAVAILFLIGFILFRRYRRKRKAGSKTGSWIQMRQI